MGELNKKPIHNVFKDYRKMNLVNPYRFKSSLPIATILNRYKFEDDVTDSVGGQDGTPTAITYTTNGVGKSGVFNGTTSNVNLPSQLISGTDSFSLSAIVNFNVLTTRQDLFSTNGPLHSVLFRLHESKAMQSIIYTTDGIFAIMATTLCNNINQNYHFITTYDGINLKVYLDGALVGSVSATGTIVTGGSNSKLGAILTSIPPLNRLNGKLDEVIVWNYTLTDDECLDLANQQLAGIEI